MTNWSVMWAVAALLSLGCQSEGGGGSSEGGAVAQGDLPAGGAAPSGGSTGPAGGSPEPTAGAPAGGVPAAGAPPEPVGGDPVGGDPEPVGGDPVGGDPEPVGGDPAPVGGEPEPVGGEPEPVGGEPEPVGGEPEPVGGDPAPAGACDNAADRGALAVGDVSTAIGECALQCLAGAACVGGCVRDRLGLTEACAVCFEQVFACTLASCGVQCLDPNSAACTTCQAENCLPDFTDCAGVEDPGCEPPPRGAARPRGGAGRASANSTVVAFQPHSRDHRIDLIESARYQ